MFVRKRIAGMWIPGSVVDPLEFEYIDRDIADALDSNGGTYALAAALILGGAGLSLSGTTHEITGTLTTQNGAVVAVVNGGQIVATGTSSSISLAVVSGVARLSVQSGGVARVLAGGALDIFGGATIKSTGALSVDSGGSVTVLAGATLNLAGTQNVTNTVIVRTGGDITCESGGTVVGDTGSILAWEGQALFQGDTIFADDTWPLLTPDRPWERRDIEVSFCTFNGGAGDGPDLADAWTAPSATGNASCIRTSSATAGGARSVIGWKDLPPGATITSVTIETIGGNTSFSTVPTYTIVRWQTGSDTLELLSSVVPDAHVVGDWNTTNLTATITPTSALVIDKEWRYGLRVTHPHAIAGTYLRILDCVAIGTADHLQNT